MLIENAADVGRRAMLDLEARIVVGLPKKADEVGIGFKNDERAVRAEAAQYLRGEGAHAGAELDHGARLRPVHLRQDLVDEEP
jgi:hypothetical protein